jgi:hypothetical protein
VDAYLKPLWWYAFNFGCGEREWLGLPYEHAKPLSGALYYPRLQELSVWLKEQREKGVDNYLLEAEPLESLQYSMELQEKGVNSKQIQRYAGSNNAGVILYSLVYE